MLMLRRLAWAWQSATEKAPAGELTVLKIFCSAVKGSEDVLVCLEVVEATVCLSGWPSIPETVLQVGINMCCCGFV